MEVPIDKNQGPVFFLNYRIRYFRRTVSESPIL
jgi:hypothetical protein